MTRWATVGEAYLERELKKERRAGVEHYVVGQHKAEVVEEDGQKAAILSYVSSLGVTTVVLVKKGPYWLPVHNWARVVGLSVDYGLKPLPDDWELTDEMKAAIDAAEKERNTE